MSESVVFEFSLVDSNLYVILSSNLNSIVSLSNVLEILLPILDKSERYIDVVIFPSILDKSSTGIYLRE